MSEPPMSPDDLDAELEPPSQAEEAMAELLSSTGLPDEDDAWRADVLAEIDAMPAEALEPEPGEPTQPGEPQRPWIAIAASLAAAAALLLWLARPTPSTPEPTPGPHDQVAPAPRLELRTIAGSGVMRGTEAHVGDELELRATTAGHAEAELWVYANDRTLLLRCPNQAGCSREGDELRGHLPLRGRGRIQAVLVLSDGPIPPPEGALGPDARRAAEAGATMLMADPLEVR